MRMMIRKRSRRRRLLIRPEVLVEEYDQQNKNVEQESDGTKGSENGQQWNRLYSLCGGCHTQHLIKKKHISKSIFNLQSAQRDTV